MASRTVPFPESIGRFRVEAVLGSGGMGEVYKAIDPTLRRTVAVKTVRPDISNPDYLGRLLREAQACASLQHPHIVTVYEAGEIEGVVYIVMEYLQGEDLAQVLQSGRLTFEERIRTLIQILEALEYAHSKGVIHRDIKPGNVWRLPDGTIKIVDFGLARMTKAEARTATGMMMGTPHYASPEQLRGAPVDRRTDIYSTGTMAYEMCSGRRPFESENDSLASMVLKVVSEPPPPMDVSWSRTFPEVERIVARAMSKSRDDRYQSAEDMKNAFAAFLASSRDAIAAAQAHETVSAQRVVIEARGLIASGKTDHAQTLLTETLRANPHATGVRQFLEEINAVPPSPGTTISPEEQATGPVPVPVVQSPSQPASSSRTLWWVGGIAAAGVGAVWLLGLPMITDMPRSEPVAAIQSKQNGIAPPIIATPANHTVTTQDVGRAIDTPPVLPGAARTASGEQVAANTPTAAVVPASKDVSARTLFYGNGKPAAAAGEPPGGPTGLRYRLTQQATSGSETDVDPASAVFRSGDRVRFAFESNSDGYLYVVQEGTSGRWTVLFPSPEINGGRNAIRHSEEYLVPPDGWFAFDANPGTEQVFVLLSKEPLSELPGFNTPVTKTESLNASVVELLQQRIRPRDLKFERDARAQPQGGKMIQASYVVNRTELGKAVSVSLSLNHTQ